MSKYLLDVRIGGEEVTIYDQTQQEIAVWILEDLPFIKIRKQSPYYSVKFDERKRGEQAKATIKEGN